MPEKPNARAVAAGIVADWLETRDFPDRRVDRVETDAAFVMELVYGTVRRRRALDWLIGRLARRPPEPPVRALLMVGLYQLFYLDAVAVYAAVNETVQASKAAGGGSAGFINAILRRALREKAALEAALKAAPLGVRESHPEMLVRRWVRRWGPERAEALCRWDNTRAGVILRVNRGRVGLAELQGRLAAAGVTSAPHPFRPAQYLALDPGARVADLPGYAEGLFWVQDPSMSLPVELLEAQPGEHVLDACAAPGGKTCHLAECLKGEGSVTAMDLHDDRLAVLRENTARLQLGTVRVCGGDAAGDGPERAAGGRPFDRILLDVPCSNTGVLRRRPDARWRFSERRLAALRVTQRAMLERAAAALKPGGTLVYSTCSLEPDEGADGLAAWLADRRDFSLLRAETLFPPDTGTDGLFAASCRRQP